MSKHKTYDLRIPRSVLIVEDEPVQRGMLLKAMPDMGFECAAVASGEEALKVLGQASYTVAILDLNLPGISGMKLFDLIRDNWPGMSVVIMTGYGDLSTAKQAIRMDVVDFLTKPTTLGEIEQALDHAYRRAVIVNADPAKLAPPRESIEAIAPAQDRSDLNLQHIERDAIIESLKRADGNRTEAAKVLGISVRTLYYRLSQYNLDL